MVPANELAGIRATLVGTMLDQCTIVRAGAPVDDGQGGQTPGPATRTGPLPCAYLPGRTLETRQGGGDQVVARQPAEVHLPALTDVLEQDQIAILVKGAATPFTVEVSSVAREGDEIWRIVEVTDLHAQ